MILNLAAWAAALFMAASMFGSTVALRLILLLAGTLLAALATARDRKTLVLLPPIWTAFAAWALWSTLSLAWSVEPERTEKELRNEVVYAAFALWMCFVAAQARSATRIVPPVLGTAAVALCAVALYIFHFSPETLLTGWHGGPGALSSALITLMPCLVMLGWYAAGSVVGSLQLRRWVTWCSVALAPLLLAAAYTSLNRTIWVAFAVQLSLLGALLLARSSWLRQGFLSLRTKMAMLVVAVGLAGAAAGMLLSVQAARHMNALHDTRLALWPHILRQIAEQPLTGYGFGRGLLRDYLEQQLGGLDTHLWHAHNIFLEALLQLGIPGLILFLWLLGATARQGWVCARDPDRRVAACGMALLAVLVGMLIRNSTDSLFVRQSALLYWGVVGILLAWGTARARRAVPSSQ